MDRSRLALLLLALPLVAGCRPSTITEAEAKADVKWLDQNGTPDAIAAIGRLADKNPKAEAALEGRSSFDVHAFSAAWAAVLRDQAWGASLLRQGLADAKRADLAASAMERHEAHLAAFVTDLENALARIAAALANFNVASTLASVGPAAHQAIERRLNDAATRGPMCRGIASKEADADARGVLLAVPESARDDAACVDAVVRVAVDDDSALAWLADKAEPGLLGAAGRSPTFACARLHTLWAKALASRAPATYPALTVPLSLAIKRCTTEMDGVIADSLAHIPASHAAVLGAIDPYEAYGRALHATCAALPAIAAGRDASIVRERASDAFHHGCSAP